MGLEESLRSARQQRGGDVRHSNRSGSRSVTRTSSRPGSSAYFPRSSQMGELHSGAMSPKVARQSTRSKDNRASARALAKEVKAKLKTAESRGGGDIAKPAAASNPAKQAWGESNAMMMPSSARSNRSTTRSGSFGMTPGGSDAGSDKKLNAVQVYTIPSPFASHAAAAAEAAAACATPLT
jgi:hypothetical protein